MATTQLERGPRPAPPIEVLLGLSVAAESAGLAAGAFHDGGDWLFAAGFVLMVLLLPLFLSQEMQRGGSWLPSIVMSIVVASSALLAIAVLVPARSDTTAATEFADVKTTFPIPKALAESVKKYGTERALQDLQAMAAKDPSISAQSHSIAHAIGELSLLRYPSVGEALAHCTNDFQSGCIHGVVISNLESSSDPNAFIKVCAPGDVKGSDFLRFNCLHGLGHASMSLSKYNLQDALQRCDTLGVEWDASSCYGGVFMENVVQLWEGNDFLTTYKPDDHLYPCTALDQKYLVQCYLMQSSVILILNKYDFAAAFTECDGAPTNFLSLCYVSLGREVSGYTLRSAPDTLRLCGLARSEMRDSCLVGAAKNYVDFFGRIDEGIALCASADVPLRRSCYFAIGEEVGVLTADVKQRAEDCRKVEPGFQDACLAGARVQ